MDFSDQFDGKLFKPYNKMDKMGKFCEFSTTQAAPVVTKQSQITQKQAQVAAVDSLFVEEKDDQGFENVGEKVRGKQEVLAKGQYNKNWNTQKQAQMTKQKQVKDNNNALLAAANFQAPQQTKKRQKYSDNLARINKNMNAANYGAQWQRRGIREPSYEVKPEWEVI